MFCILFFVICFITSQGLWDVKRDGSEGCILKVYTNVAFSKKTMWKGAVLLYISIPGNLRAFEL